MRTIAVAFVCFGICFGRRVQPSIHGSQASKQTLQVETPPSAFSVATEKSLNVMKTILHKGDEFVHKSYGPPTIALCVIILLLAVHALRKRRQGPIDVAPSGPFDYIVIGGGLAGSVLAARLSEDASKSVLVIEPGTASPNNLLIKISGAILKLFRNPRFDWCWQTVEEAGCSGRQISLPRGKLLGGSTCLNAQVALRGSPHDYEDWGNGWSPKEVAPTFDSIEFRDGEPMKNCGMHMQLPNYQHELSKRFLETCSSGESIHTDLKHSTDFNEWDEKGNNSIGSGFGRFELSQRNGTRWTAASSYLAVAMSRPNVTVLTGHTVARVTLSSTKGELAASGVALKDVTGKTKASQKAFARKELKRVLREGANEWRKLQTQLNQFEASAPNKSTGQLDAARKLISNHEAVLRDATNLEPLSQLHLKRVSTLGSKDADKGLQEVARRLLEASVGSVRRGPQGHEEASVWVTLATFLEGRIQSTPGEFSGRRPDMDEQAANALRSALRSVKDDASQLLAELCTENVSGEKGSTEDAIVQLAPGGEVLVAAGALASPQVLQLSGIGPASVLKAVGVPVHVDQPAVGEGLQDHPAVTVAYESRIKDGRFEINPFLTWSNMTSPIALCKWALFGSGVLSTTFCDHGAFVRSKKELALPDVQLRFVAGIGPASDGVKSYELIGKGIQYKNFGFTLQVINCRPKSVGSIRIVSTDPSVSPEVRCNYLSKSEDKESLKSGVQLARRLATSGALGEVSLEEVYPGPSVKTESDLDTYISSTLHSANGLSGGCCIGSVVDQELKVKGVAGLRVVDASVMPSIPGAQLALPTAMIAERAATFITGRQPVKK